MTILFEILKTIGIAGIVGVTWLIATRLATLQATLTLLIDNHLPHLENEIAQMRKDFTTHLERRAK